VLFRSPKPRITKSRRRTKEKYVVLILNRLDAV